jgi:hypothetical protein
MSAGGNTLDALAADLMLIVSTADFTKENRTLPEKLRRSPTANRQSIAQRAGTPKETTRPHTRSSVVIAEARKSIELTRPFLRSQVGQTKSPVTDVLLRARTPYTSTSPGPMDIPLSPPVAPEANQSVSASVSTSGQGEAGKRAVRPLRSLNSSPMPQCIIIKCTSIMVASFDRFLLHLLICFSAGGRASTAAAAAAHRRPTRSDRP